MKHLQSISKYIVSVMIIVSVVFSGQRQASASYTAVTEFGYNLVTNILTTGYELYNGAQNYITAYTASQTWIKDTVLDRIFVALAKALINKIKQDMIAWINSGFKGKPLYLDKPEEFFKNIGIEQLALVKSQLLNTAAYANADIYKALQTNINSTFKTSITPTVDTSILNGLCPSTEQYITDNQDRIATRTLGGENVSQREYDYFNNKKAIYDKYCNGGEMTKEKYDGLMNAWASDTSNGGWGPLIAITQNQDRNTQQGRLLLAQNQLAAQTANKTNQANAELNRSGGFLDQKKCTEYTTATASDAEDNPNISVGDQICKTSVTITPGKAAADMLGQVVEDPIQQAQLVKTINDAIDAVLGAFISKLTTDGLAAAGGALSNYGQQTVSASSSSYELTTTQRDTVLKTLLPNAELQLKNQSKAKGYLQKEYDRYAELFDAYNQVYLCYKNANNEAAIPQSIRTRAGEVKLKVDNLKKELDNAANGETLISNYISNLKSATNYLSIENLNKQYDKDVADGKILDFTTMELRNQANENGTDGKGGVFAALRTEISTVAQPALVYCQSLTAK